MERSTATAAWLSGDEFLMLVTAELDAMQREFATRRALRATKCWTPIWESAGVRLTVLLWRPSCT